MISTALMLLANTLLFSLRLVAHIVKKMCSKMQISPVKK